MSSAFRQRSYETSTRAPKGNVEYALSVVAEASALCLSALRALRAGWNRDRRSCPWNPGNERGLEVAAPGS